MTLATCTGLALASFAIVMLGTWRRDGRPRIRSVLRRIFWRQPGLICLVPESPHAGFLRDVNADRARLNRSDPGGSSTVLTRASEVPRQGRPFAPDGPVGGPAAIPSGTAVSKRQSPLRLPLLGDVRGHRGEHEGSSSDG